MDIKGEPPNAAEDDYAQASFAQVVSNSSGGQVGQIVITCVKCKQKIPFTDRFFNLPTNASRRRIWCDRLGFNFNATMAKQKSWNAKPICTRHFAVSELATHTTKAKMERCGYPLALRNNSAQRPNLKSMRVKRQPWPCTMCSFSCFSVLELFDHVSQLHLTGRIIKRSFDGFACPFCRRCAYGYRTLSGFERHMSFSPTQHFLLHKIVESAKAQGRESYLTPVDSWATWTEENVAMALFGFVPKPIEKRIAPEPINRRMSADERNVRRVLSAEALLATKYANSTQSATAILTESVPLTLDFLNCSEDSSFNTVSIALEDSSSSDYQSSSSSPPPPPPPLTPIGNQQLVAEVKQEVDDVAATNGFDFPADASGGISATSIMAQGRGDLHFAHDNVGGTDDNDEEFISTGAVSEMEPSPRLTLADLLPSTTDDDSFDAVASSSSSTAKLLKQSTGGETTARLPPPLPTINPLWARRQQILDKMMTRKMESAENRRKFFGPIDADGDDAVQAAPRSGVARLMLKTTPSRLVVAPSDDTPSSPADGVVIGSDCPVCGIRFFSDGALRKHMFGVHGAT